MKRFLVCLALVVALPGAFAADPVLESLLGDSRRDNLGTQQLRIARKGDGYELVFWAVLNSVSVRGAIVPADRDELVALNRQMALVPLGRADRYLLYPASRYYFVRFEPGHANAVHISTPDGRVHRTPYVPAAIVLEVVGGREHEYLQLHLLRRPHPESLESFVFSGLHDATDRNAAKRTPCTFEMILEGK